MRIKKQNTKHIKYLVARNHPIFKQKRSKDLYKPRAHAAHRDAARRLLYGETNFTMLPHDEFTRRRRLNSKRHLKLRIGKSHTHLPRDLTIRKLRKNLHTEKFMSKGKFLKYIAKVPSHNFVLDNNYPTGSFDVLAVKYSSPQGFGRGSWTSLFMGQLAKRAHRLPEDRTIPPGL